MHQSRLYTLAVQTEAAAEEQQILASFEAFPVSSMRGGLLSSEAPAKIRPPLRLSEVAQEACQTGCR